MGLFYFFGGDGTDRAGLGGGYIPRRWRPKPQRTRKDCISQAAGQAVPKYQGGQVPGQTTARTLGTLHRSALNTRQDTRCRSYKRRALDCLCNLSGKVYNFGRFILSIFIWIYFAESIDNPYIYGYNIISPDKYGLQPQYTKTGGQNHDEQ